MEIIKRGRDKERERGSHKETNGLGGRRSQDAVWGGGGGGAKQEGTVKRETEREIQGEREREKKKNNNKNKNKNKKEKKANFRIGKRMCVCGGGGIILPIKVAAW